MLVLHGEHLVNSRQKLQTQLEQARAAGSQVIRLSASKLTVAELELALGGDSLFGEPKVVVIEELHSLPTSQRKTALIKAVATAAGQPTTPEIILWEKRALTPTMLKQFPAAKADESKLSKQLFSWLDSLSGSSQAKTKQIQYFHQVLEQEAAELCFAMLTRQIRLLLQAKSGGTLKGAPFMVTKLKNQAKNFELGQLVSIHSQLLTLDLALKTGKNPGTLTQALDLLIWKW